MNRTLRIILLIVALGGLCGFMSGISTPVGPSQGGAGSMTGAPFGFRFFGDGSEGAVTCNGANLTGEHWVTTFTVANGQICTVPSSATSLEGLVIRATDTCTIAGTINARGADTAFSALVNANAGGSGGGGGFGAVNGQIGGQTTSFTIIGAAAGAIGTSGVPGGPGATPSTSYQKRVVSYMSSFLNGGSSGGQGGSSGGALGRGGQQVVLVCKKINFTGTINVAGQNGGAGGASTGGGGGGGGGVVIESALTYIANTGTITVTHGTGGVIGTGTSTAGGDGGDGWSTALTVQ